jgi:hypothetical protein
MQKNAKTNTMVSEDGIRGLCVIGKCKLIHTLLLDEYNIVTEKVIQIVIENLPALRIFNHRFTVRALANLHRKALGKTPYILPEFALSNLGVYIGQEKDNRTTTEDCELAVAVCPFITKVTVIYGGFELVDDDFLFLHKIKSLTNLHMKKSTFDTKHNYVIGLARLFKSVGSSLTFLKLDSFPKVDICDIIEFCPNLRSINLTYNTYDDGTTKHRKKKNFLLKKLEMLYFWSSVCANFQPEILSILLSSPSLVYVCINHCNFLTDDVLAGAADLHQFPKLEQIIINGCCSATEKGCEAMINKCKSIREFEFLIYTQVGFFQGCRKQPVHRNWERDFSTDSFSSFDVCFECRKTCIREHPLYRFPM